MIVPSKTPCKRGHMSGRYKSSGQCVECVRLYKKAAKGLSRVCVYVPDGQEHIIDAQALAMRIDAGFDK